MSFLKINKQEILNNENILGHTFKWTALFSDSITYHNNDSHT